MKKKKQGLPGRSCPDRDFREASKLLEGKSRLLDSIMESMGDGLSLQDRNMRIVYQNRYMRENFGSHRGEYCYRIYERRHRICDDCPIREAYRTGEVVRALRVGTTKEGKQFRFENIASLLKNEKGEIVAGLELVRQVEDRERAFDELRAATEKLMQAKAIYENSSEGIMVTDRENRIISVNPAFQSITGYSAKEVLGSDPKILSSGRHSPDFYAQIWHSLREKGSWRGEIWNRRRDGSLYIQSMSIDTILDEGGKVVQRVCVFSDITEKKMAEQKIEYMARHDALTGLPNRILFTDRLQQALALARREKRRLALLYIDLDNFKTINDTLGHLAGDVLLRVAAQRMNGCIRESDVVARVGGDEFTVLLPRIREPQDALTVAEKIRWELETPFEINGKEMKISCSIGGAFFPADGSNEEELTHNADKAMYHAKREGRNRVYFREMKSMKKGDN